MNGELTLEETPHGLQVHYGGRRLYGRAPRADAARRANSLALPPNSLILWPSPVLWHGASELLGRLNDSSVVVAVEADGVLRELARRYLPQSERIVLISADPSALVTTLRDLGEHRFRRVVELTTASSAMLHREAYRTARALLEREIQIYWQNRMTLASMGRLWLRNTIRNIPSLAGGLPLENAAGPVIVCGAGPSLDAAIPFILGHRHELRVVTVDTALPALTARRIRPDLVLALEGQLANVYDFLPVQDRSYRLVADTSSSPAAIELHPNRSWTLTDFAPVTLLDRLASLAPQAARFPPLGSVGVAAVRLAIDLGAAPVLCAGLDFAVQPGQTHARGAPSYLHGHATATRLGPVRDPALGARIISAKGFRGPVRSTLVLKSYADELNATIGNRDDIYVVEPLGIGLTARAVSLAEAADIVTGQHTRPARAVADTPAPRRPDGAVVASFIDREMELLESLDLSDDAATETLPPEVDYLACEAPDLIASFARPIRLLPLGRAARARLRVARAYYLDRWRTIRDVVTTTSRRT